MHPSSMENMKRARDLLGNRIASNIEILDVGGRALVKDRDRSYRSLWEDKAKEYYVADLMDGHNVTHPMPGPYELPFSEETVDLIVSGQTLEHVKNPFRLVAEMNRVLKKGGYMILIAPSRGKYHDSIDCWRFMDDAFAAVAEEVGNIETVADWVDRSAPDERSSQWGDHVFVGKKF